MIHARHMKSSKKLMEEINSPELQEALEELQKSLGNLNQQDLRKALEAKTGKKVRLRIEVEPELIGGAVVRIGDRVYDGSVQHQLESLRDQLAERAYLSN